jgi:hypothetical protein
MATAALRGACDLEGGEARAVLVAPASAVRELLPQPVCSCGPKSPVLRSGHGPFRVAAPLKFGNAHGEFDVPLAHHHHPRLHEPKGPGIALFRTHRAISCSNSDCLRVRLSGLENISVAAEYQFCLRPPSVLATSLCNHHLPDREGGHMLKAPPPVWPTQTLSKTYLPS